MVDWPTEGSGRTEPRSYTLQGEGAILQDAAYPLNKNQNQTHIQPRGKGSGSLLTIIPNVYHLLEELLQPIPMTLDSGSLGDTFLPWDNHRADDLEAEVTPGHVGFSRYRTSRQRKGSPEWLG